MLAAILVLSQAAVPVYAEDGVKETMPSGTALSLLETVTDLFVRSNEKTTAAVAVAYVNEGRTIFDKAYGMADMEHGTEANADTVFEWGSCTKLLVWTSVMQLVEQGKLDLNADIREYLPGGFLSKLKYDDPITLLNLMHHTAGFQDRITDMYYNSETDLLELGEALDRFEPGQVYRPGETVAYSNYGAALAGYIVELQSGKPFYTYVKEHIFDVLGMERTAIHPAQHDNPAVAEARNSIRGYTTGLKYMPENRGFINLYPAGAAIGTAGDAAKFLAALMPAGGGAGPLFQKEATLQEMLSPSLNYDGTSIPRIAHGFFINQYAVPALEHGGNTVGFSSRFVFDPASGFGMVVMTNQNGEEVYNTGLVEKIFGASISAAQAYTGQMPEVAEVEGVYLRARRMVSGYAKILTMTNFLTVTKVNSQFYKDQNGVSFIQTAPYEYLPVGHSGVQVFSQEAGKVVKTSNTYGDYYKVSNFTAHIATISLFVLGIGLLYNVVALLGELIKWIFRKMKTPAKPQMGPSFTKHHLWMNAAGVIVTANLAALVYRTINYTAYSAILIHLILNILYVVLAAAYVILLALKLRRADGGRFRKTVYILTGLTGLLFAVLIVGWDMYY
ncbi:serine hydrolase domain-containing protein [Paenibacillus tengchongensis]|uniref:serine hydrolase domain-containing protein n=1 Tax=Paenibacillus tengchongensis TaxID=2608684 RepID=UPI001651E929|nr:serine hydrolase domain-containing protein [Paenibacillus tengchongensis]